jgi:signal peptidase I
MLLMSGPRDDIKRFFSAHPDLYQFLKDLIFSLAFVAAVALVLYLYAGTWSPVVSVDGTSMLDHMHAGDLVLVQGLDRGPVKTYEESVNTNYWQYGEPGDVIV